MTARAVLVRLHRYAGLTIALFLIFAGLTGSVIAFNEELDAWLNPSLFRAQDSGPALSPDRLVARVEAQLPQAKVAFFSLEDEPGRARQLRVEGKNGAILPYDEVFADPASGRILGKRLWGACCFAPEQLMPFLYIAHYSLKIPGTWGVVLMGGIALLWTLDCFVGFLLTLPRGRPFPEKWASAWKIKRPAGGYRLHLDLHRAGGLWFWLVLFVVASSGVALNLREQIFRPLVGMVSTLSPSIFDEGSKRLTATPMPARLTYADAIAQARKEADTDITPVSIFHEPEYGVYGVGFTRAGQSAETGLGASYFYIDDRNGKLVEKDVMGAGTAGDVYMQAQYPLHSGRILGLPGRILISVSGLLVAMLSVTGIVIWLRKRQKPARAAVRLPVPAPKEMAYERH
ncbi:MAG: PepSY domain-containing protein [Alphaproteobacteria bacterium]|jgi:uncharacterized iron-regulated membrane protein|nr:PepSY domain-containing protein [Alphaproteobacteria bacterium]